MRKRGYYVNNTLLRASGQVNSKGRQSNRGTGVSTYNIWGEKGLKKARD